MKKPDECEERPPNVFPLMELPVELRCEIIRNLSSKEQAEARLISHYMDSLIRNYWSRVPRTFRNTMVDYHSERWSAYTRWLVLPSCSSLVERLRCARGAVIPCLSFHKIKLSSFLLERLSHAVLVSRVTVVQCEFAHCRFHFEARDLIKFLRLCKVQKLVIVNVSIEARVCEKLVNSGFIKKVCDLDFIFAV
ncbi:hypothetical protein Y032_0031g2316 [Ancylostoma ceylanicum]|uniref:F-box domain-containing protein n=1 Tax=Ancylostoma ceylanicum TaxID=53326 RepID=A0A016UP57_9BILA|nr:hypothetical protein Y032_0031g2316 [Ancylostoma ceylanicum]